jgi:hypothetical protein
LPSFFKFAEKEMDSPEMLAIPCFAGFSLKNPSETKPYGNPAPKKSLRLPLTRKT